MIVKSAATPDLALVTRNLPAIILMVVSMALFAVEDALIKVGSSEAGVGQILVVVCLIGMTGFALLSLASGRPVVTRDIAHRTVIIRCVAEVIGTLCFVTALTLIPLSNASAILQATPLAVTLGAALVLGETVGWRRWTAIGVGFAGVLLVVRPGLQGFDANAIFALGGVAGLAVRDLATRRLPASISSLQVSAWAYFAILVPATVLMMIQGGWQPLSSANLLALTGAGLIGIVGYWMVTTATRIGEASVVAPFRYTRLLFGALAGFIAFNERPDTLMFAGSTLIIGSGLYAFYREHKRRSEALAARRAAAALQSPEPNPHL